MEVKFIYMYKIFKNYIMAIISKVSRKENDFMIENKNDQNDIEFIYNLIIKLQEDYIQQSSKK